MKISFPYYQSPDGGDFPIARVSLSYRLRTTDVYPLVDSGAGVSLFDSTVADKLGVPLRKGEKVDMGGVGGRIRGHIYTISMTIGKKRFKAPVVFSDELEIGVNLLGRQGVFEIFSLPSMKRRSKRTSESGNLSLILSFFHFDIHFFASMLCQRAMQP
ncbi:MAG: hypothetical protein A3A65_04745 [Candidatus Chisholmbacteria bacterium RIFCSPLOWO2_01_FULL_49_14]|uniref:Peptidase A2 domain-containing protein n=1 Tax=Candidatus Chisholmbacteria bacterium RIFCSPLOWO2_01_FULL_49_14 TaxID=1797593 RepID=A0A1G1W498_9BACT|nr:MAG: hypothetical protein A3A65_04745 [Candidatus Chisholmbacteria bacterium RIFCSPLOWO2_01_FULL_49_14]